MNFEILGYIILILLIIILIISTISYKQNEKFTSNINNFNKKIDKYILKELNQYNNFSKKSLKNYHKKYPDSSALIEVVNGKIKIYNATEQLQQLMKKVSLPKNVTFVISYEDQGISENIPVFQNSVFINEKGILSPYWYWFVKDRVKNVLSDRTPWYSKRKQAFWRGSTTGYSGQDYRSGRKISRKYVVDTSKQFPKLIDASFTNLVQKAGEILENNYSTKPPVDALEQSRKYKYIVSVDGNGGTNGLYWVLSSGSTAIVNSQFRQWFTPFFTSDCVIPFSDDENHSNLHLVIQKLLSNDDLAKETSRKSKKIAKEIFNEKFIINYMNRLIELFAKKQSFN